MAFQDEKKIHPFAGLDGRRESVISANGLTTIKSLKDADEALTFLENHPRAAEIAEEGQAILEDPVQLKKLIRKIDFTIAPLLAAVYFLQFLDKTTLSYTAVMGIRTDTHLVGQDYSNLSMLFYVGTFAVAGWQIPTEPGCRWSVVLMFGVLCRFFGGGIPDAVLGSASVSIGPLSRREHHDMGSHSWLPCCLYNVRRPCYLSNPSGNI